MQLLWDFLKTHNAHIFFGAGLIFGIIAAIHAAMSKKDVRSAIAWVGVVILSPFFGALLYFVAGINRIRRNRKLQLQNDRLTEKIRHEYDPASNIANICGSRFASLKNVGDHFLSPYPVWGGNAIEVLSQGTTAYSHMLEAINNAQHTIVLQSYIFDNDLVGRQFADTIIAAFKRGVDVRILIDAIGVKYSRPTILHLLRKAGIPHALFGPSYISWRMPYANLRCHRKILVVDGQIGFAGGMNIREHFDSQLYGENAMRDTHFKFKGPIVLQLLAVFMKDWEFACHEKLNLKHWQTKPQADNTYNIAARCIPSGPDKQILATHNMLLAACAVARTSIVIQSPYFLPDQVLLGALNTAARRGVKVDILIPGKNNLRLINYAMMAQLDQVMHSGCRVWQDTGNFDHSKLMVVDNTWTLIGSSNLDSRSLRLNFEIDIEVYDPSFAQKIASNVYSHIEKAEEITLTSLNKLPFFKKLRNKIIWLATPYL